MADAFTSFFNLIKMETNSHENDWGTQLNNNFDIIDRLHRARVHSVVGTLLTLVEDQVLELIHEVTGNLSANQIIEVPFDTQKAYFWRNNTTGAFTLTVRVAGHAGVVIEQGDTKLLYCNGTDVIDQGIPTNSDVADSGGGGGGTPPIEWVGDAAGTNAYSVTGAGLTLVDGLSIACYIANGTTALPITLSLNGGGPLPIVHNDGTALATNAIPNGSVKNFRYRGLPFTKWYMAEVSPSTIPSGGGGGGSTFDDIVITGSVTEVPTALADGTNIAWNMAATSRNVTVTLGGNRNLSAPTNPVVGQWGHIEFVQDGTGQRTISLDGVFDPPGTAISLDPNPNARTIFGYYVRTASLIAIWPLYRSTRNSISTWFEIDMGALSSSGTPPVKSANHLLGRYPALVQFYLECTSGNLSYTVGQRVLIGDAKDADNDRGFTCGFDTATVFVKQGANPAFLIQAAGNAALTVSAWKVIARVYE